MLLRSSSFVFCRCLSFCNCWLGCSHCTAVLFMLDYACCLHSCCPVILFTEKEQVEAEEIKRLRPWQLFFQFSLKGGSKLCACSVFFSLFVYKHYALECANMNAHNSIQCHLMEFVYVCVRLSVCIYFIVNNSIGIS